MSIKHYIISLYSQDNDQLQAIKLCLEKLGHLLHNEVDGLVLLGGQGGEEDLDQHLCTGVWS